MLHAGSRHRLSAASGLKIYRWIVGLEVADVSFGQQLVQVLYHFDFVACHDADALTHSFELLGVLLKDSLRFAL